MVGAAKADERQLPSSRKVSSGLCGPTEHFMKSSA
jgi:hypothetical protein